MMTVAEVAKMLSISVQSVYSIIDAGKLTAHRFGAGRGTIRVSEGDLKAYIESCRIQKEEPPRRAAPLRHIKL